MYVLLLIYRRQRNHHYYGEQSNRMLVAAPQSLMFVWHCLPLVSNVQHMDMQSSTITVTCRASVGTIAIPISIKWKQTFLASTVVFKRSRPFVFYSNYKLLFVALSSNTWAGLLHWLCSKVLCIILSTEWTESAVNSCCFYSIPVCRNIWNLHGFDIWP